MQLVIEIDDLKEVGFAVRDHATAFRAVQKLIASSPSLADVIGARVAGEPAVTSTDLILELLEDQTWHPTSELAQSLKLNPATVLNHLKTLEAEGRVERRMDGKPRRAEWRRTG